MSSRRSILRSALSLLVALCAVTPLALAAAVPQADFYVATSGRDSWSGKLASPNAARTDGPFATLDRARLAVREVSGHAVTVLIRGGTYRLPQPIMFQPEDSGSAARPILYSAYPGEKPIFSGGRPITGWKKGPGKLWIATLPDVQAGDWYFHQLFVNGRRAVRARQPNQGYLHTESPLPRPADLPAGTEAPDSHKGFIYKNADLKPWDGLDDANLFLYHSWTSSMHWIASLDEEKHIVRFTNPCDWLVGYWQPQNQRYHVENFRAALDQPGEWYLERKTGLLYYWPLPGEDMTRAEVVAPVRQRLLEFRPDLKAGRFIDNLTFRGLSFQHAEWVRKRDEPTDGQAAWSLTSALLLQGARHCVFDACEIAHVGEYALWLSDGCQENTISRCHIHDLGGGGIRIGMIYDPTSENQVCGHNTVDNCFLHDGGNVFPAGIGVWIGRNSYNNVTHNEVRDFYYTGISCGWSWGYSPSSADHNVIEYNHIHNIGCGVLSDLGGIYTLGIAPGTRLRFNLIHDIWADRFGAGGIYPDEGSTGLLIENNVLYNTSTGCFSQHYGRENTVRNNILAFSRVGPCAVYRVEEHTSFFFTHNIVYSDTGELIIANWARAKHDSDSNLFWDTTRGPASQFEGMSLDEWRELGHDQHSLIADPKFVDAAHFDFRLRPGSPASRIGFQPFDISPAGLYGDPAWESLPSRYPARTYVEPRHKLPARVTSIDDGFEDTPLGETPRNASANEEAPATIRVTAEAAATGKHSLKFLDAPGLKYAWQPHLVYSVPFRRGPLHVSYDVRLEAGAKLGNEFRQWLAEPYRVGPTLSFDAGGDLKAGGKTLASDLPTGKWMHVDITCPLGEQAGAYDLTVTIPGRAPIKLTGLPNGAPEFKTLTWIGFISQADAKTIFYLDNVKIFATP
jgi:hypothetical protein